MWLGSEPKEGREFFLQVYFLRSNLLHKGFKHYVEAEDPDVLVLTEIKVADYAIHPNS